MAGKKQVIPWKIVSLIMLIPSIFLNIFFLIRNYSQPVVAVPVIGVIDGDTIVVGNKDRVRLRQMAHAISLLGHDSF